MSIAQETEHRNNLETLTESPWHGLPARDPMGKMPVPREESVFLLEALSMDVPRMQLTDGPGHGARELGVDGEVVPRTVADEINGNCPHLPIYHLREVSQDAALRRGT